MSKKYLLFIFIYFYLSIIYAQKPQQLMPERTRVLFVVDASGSMNTKWDGDLRIAIAKEKLSDLIDSMKINGNVEFALRVYGHQFHHKFKNCKDSKLEVSFQRHNHSILNRKLQAIKPQGTTPIAYSLEQATKDFPNSSQYRNVIILITDGLESCDGDPCAIALGLQKKGIFLKPFIIGLGVGLDFKKAFECIGVPYDSKSGDDFRNILGDVIHQSIGRTTVTVDLLNEKNQAIETNLNMTFRNAVTEKTIYDLVHYKDKRGLPDTLDIDALITYDLKISTIPPVYKSGIVLKGGGHNTIRVKSPTGKLHLRMRASVEYANHLYAIIRRTNELKTLHNQEVGKIERYLTGKYDLEIPTIPRTYFKGVTIQQGKTKILEIPEPGLLNVRDFYEGYAHFYQLKKGKATLVHQLDWNGRVSNKLFAFQPGKYKLVYRAKNAKGSNYTVVKKFTIRSGATSEVNIFR